MTNQIDYENLKIGIISLLEFGKKNILNFKGFLIAVAFSTAIGGMMTMVGTGPNIFVKGFTDQ